MTEVLPKLAALRREAEARGLDLPIGVDGGVNLDTIGSAHAAGGDVLVTGKALYASTGDLRPVVDALRAAALASDASMPIGGEPNRASCAPPASEPITDPRRVPTDRCPPGPRHAAGGLRRFRPPSVHSSSKEPTAAAAA